MSAFMLSPETFQQIANRLPDLMGTDGAADEAIKAWQAANVRAVTFRYPRSPKPADPVVTVKYYTETKVPLAVLYKHLRCLRYQCSEEVPAAETLEHERVLAHINTIAERVACMCVEELPEYDQAPWGSPYDDSVVDPARLEYEEILAKGRKRGLDATEALSTRPESK